MEVPPVGHRGQPARPADGSRRRPADARAAARRQVVRRGPRPDRRLGRAARRRGARAGRRERRGQVDARQDPRRGVPAGQRDARDGRPGGHAARPRRARAAGIAVIYQEPTLFPDLTVAENMFIGRQPLRSGRRIDRPAMRDEAAAIFTRLGVPLDPARIARGLSIADQQIVEIGKALSLDARVIVMDEPTAALSAAEVDRLFDVIRTLRAQGAAVLFISHRLEEVFAICQRVTVMRDGRHVLTSELAGLTAADLVRAMVGRELRNGRPRRPRHARGRRCSPSAGSPARACSPTSRSRSAPARSSRWPGWSARGAARWRGPSSASTGTTRARSRCAGSSCARRRRSAAMAAGVGLVPEDRRQQGLVMDMSVEQNVALASLGRLAKAGLIRASAERATGRRLGRAAADQVRPADRPGVHAVRRQPAEGRAGQVARPQARAADRRRADPRHRRRRPRPRCTACWTSWRRAASRS